MDDFRPIDRRRASDEVAERIRELLGSGRLSPGDRLPAERVLARQLGVGRQAIREALRALEDAGVLRRKLGKTGGAFVANGDPSIVSDRMADLIRLGGVSLSQLTEARMLIEESIVRLVCVRATEADFARLDQLVDEAEALFECGLLPEKTERNILFYVRLAQATHNPALVIVMQGITGVLRQIAARLGPEPGRDAFMNRRRLIAALRKREPDLAVAVMRDNIRKAEENFSEGIARRASLAPDGVKSASRPTDHRRT
jgi:GntR family transcriptional regulator, transcriptional repressor for pyruvate dehydrogenase complex